MGVDLQLIHHVLFSVHVPWLLLAEVFHFNPSNRRGVCLPIDYWEMHGAALWTGHLLSLHKNEESSCHPAGMVCEVKHCLLNNARASGGRSVANQSI